MSPRGRSSDARAHKASILAEIHAANDPEPARESVAPGDQAVKLRALIALIVATGADADRAEALEIALAEPEAALTSFRALAADAMELTRREAHTGGA